MSDTTTIVTPERPRFDLGELLRQFGGVLLLSSSLSSTVRKVLYHLMACRTEELGGHLEVCHDCGGEQPAYNSCGDRHCPKCQSSAGARWVAKRMETFLPTHYFHCVFTLPDLLRPVILANRKPLFALLFQAVSETLLELAETPRWLGALPGFTLVLHTWSKDLSFHPHIHTVVTGGGLTPDGLAWKPTRAKFLFPVRVMSALFRGKFLAGLEKLYRRGALQFSGKQEALSQPEEFQKLLKQLYSRSWVVYAKPPFASPEYVYRYLSRYTHRVGLSNRRILDVNEGSIRLQTRGEKSVVLKMEELFRRFTLHILPDGFVRIRHYGLMSTRSLKTKLEQARTLLAATKNGSERIDAHAETDATAPQEIEKGSRCRVCGGAMSGVTHRLARHPGPLWEAAFGEMGMRMSVALAIEQRVSLP